MTSRHVNGPHGPGLAGRLAARAAALLGATALLLASAATPAPAAGSAAVADPVLVNPSFEEPVADGAIPGWQLVGAERPDTSYAVTEDAAQDGTHSLSITDGSDVYGVAIESDHFDVEVRRAYTAAAMTRVDRDQLAVYLRFYDAEGHRLTNVATPQGETGGAWTKTSITATAPEGAVTGTVLLYSATSPRGAGYFDTVTVTAGAVEPPRLTDPTPADVVAQNPRISHLGTPVTSKITTNAVLGDEGGTAVTYGVYRGHPDTDHPATFVVANADTGEVIRALPAAGAEGTFETRASTDGTIYFATTPDFHLWSYDPGTQQLRDIGPLNPQTPKDGHAFTMTAGPDGTMYIGTYPKGYLYLYDPADDSITNLGAVDPTQAYIKGLAYDFERDTLYVGTGGTRAQIFKVAPDGTTTELLSDEATPGAMDESFVSTFTFVDDRLFARVANQLLVIRADDTVEYWRGQGNEMHGYHVSARPDAPGKYVFTFGSTFWEYDSATRTTRNLGIATNGYLNDSRWVQLDDPEWPGYSLLAATQDGTVLMNPATGRSEPHTVEFANPVTVQKILTGPDSMYASGYMVGLAPFDSVTGEAGETLQSGQYESSAVRGDTMLLGSYGNGRVSEYDPAAEVAPRLLFDLKAEGQDRPFGMDYDEENDRLFVGTVAYYGSNQGALTQYDFATGEKIVHTTGIVTDQSVISVLYHDGLVYAGTTVDGSLGAPPSGQTDGHFVVFDPDTGQQVRDIIPVAGDEGVTGLTVGPDGLIWGVSEDTVFKYDPATEEIVFSEKLLRTRYGTSTVWAWAYLVTGADGNVYGTNRFSVFRIDPETMEYTLLVNGVGNYANVDANGDLLFSHGVDVYRYDVPDALQCDREITGTHTGPVAVTDGTLCVTDATVSGPITATGADTVAITGSTITGPIHLTGTTGTLTLTGNDITGAVSLTGNTTEAPSVVGDNRIDGPLACSGNAPAPVDGGDPNTVTGPTAGQCAGL
ncbi:hypothetical protein [Jiangella muralis]|uniref:hypothetical protein n=1 Tax=Jiangella muralis TaxID=702383 RepID=UPI000AEE2867|nr:hypothetical protein [Jiangella muralis]